MLKKFILAAAVLTGIGSQHTAHAQALKCGHDQAYHELLQKHPEIAVQEAQLEAEITRQLAGMDVSKFAKTTGLASDTETLHIPLVFHIIHGNYGADNVPDNAVYQYVREINSVFQKRNADTSVVIQTYRGNVPGTNTRYIGKTNFEFHLAQRDPQGRPTNGITRRRHYLSNGGDNNAKFDGWAPDSYMNIWIINDFSATNTAGAYAYKPATADIIPYFDGVIAAFSRLGGNANSDYTLAHELGHEFNLSHTFGDQNTTTNIPCGDDNVDDTPPTNGGAGDGCSGLASILDSACTQSFVVVARPNPDVTDTFPDRVANRGITFNTRTRVRIRNVTIYSHDTVGAPFTILLRRNGSLVSTYTGTVAFGNGIPQVVPVSFLCPPGDPYTMTFGINPNARRDSLKGGLTTAQTGVAGAIRLTDAGTDGYYNYFYNWDVQHGYFKIYNGAAMIALYDDSTTIPKVDGAYVIDYPDTVNAQNVMDYQFCSKMFTNGQALRMRAAARSTIGRRASLITVTNQVATGIRSGNDFPARADVRPVADFSVGNFSGTNATEKVYVCPGINVNFTNRSWQDTIATADWTLSGGASVPTSTSLTTVSSTFSQPGPVDVRLIVTGNNGTGSDTEERQHVVYVADVNNKINPNGYYQEWTDANDNSRYPIFNYFNNEHKWELSGTGFYDNSSIRYKTYDERTGLAASFGSPGGDYDDFFMPPVDLTSMSSGQCFLNFAYAGATRTASVNDMNDIFEIAYSVNCGDNWITLRSMTKGELHNNGTRSYNWAPDGNQGSSNWTPTSTTIPNSARQSTVLFRFRYRPGTLRNGSLFGSGNNFYIDRMHFSDAPAGVDAALIKEEGFALAPNPTQGGASVVMKGSVNGATMTVTDVTGKLVYRSDNAQQTTGYTTFQIPAQAVSAKGIYFVRVGHGNTAHTEKLVVY